MNYIMGKISKGVECSLNDCSSSAIRSINSKNVDSNEFSISSDSNKVYFCTEHYKSWKKSTKELRKSERARYYV